jgi:glutathione S-transferase
MTRVLYELLGADDRRFSPFCWRARMALAHKGVAVDYEPCGFTEKDKFAFADSKTVPVLVDGDKTVADSWAIAEYLEAAYPDAPSLFGGAAGQALARFVSHWCDAVLHPAVFRVVVADLFEVVRPVDQAYFRQSREKRLGMTLEAARAKRGDWAPRLTSALAPLRAHLGERDFVCGAAPAYADYIVFGAFQWARCASAYPVLAEEPAIAAWRARMLDLHDALARSVPALDAVA